MSATDQNLNYPRCKSKNCWHSVDAHSQHWVVTVLQTPLRQQLPIHRLCITTTRSQFNYCSYKITNCWRSVDSYFNVLSIQHPLPSIIVFVTIWTYWLSSWQIVTRPYGKAERSNILALFTLKLLKFIYLAKRFIMPAIHLFMNPYSQATAHHSPRIYL